MFNDQNNTQDIETYLKSNPTLEQLLDFPSFQNDIAYQSDPIFDYLAKDQKIEKMLNYIIAPQVKGISFQQAAKYAFLSFKVISDCHPKITELIITNKNHMKLLFSLINDNAEANITSRGYFQSILKNFLTDLNPHLYLFVKELKSQAERYIFPLVKNLNKSNAEIIKDILSSQNEKLKKLQLCIFEFLLFYYLNEQFKMQDLEEKFSNLNEIFIFLKTVDEIYSYKLKYQHTLYSEEFVRNKEYREFIYSFKLVLLNYIAHTEQIKEVQNPTKFLLSYKKYKKSKKSLFYLKDMLNFFDTVTKNKESHQHIDLHFIETLLEIIKEYPYKDVIHALVVKIFENLTDLINKDKRIVNIITEFILYQKEHTALPQQTKKHINRVSQHYIFQMVKILDLTQLANSPHREDMLHLKDLYATIFTKLCFEENDNDISETVETSEIIPTKDLNFFKKGSRVIPENDKRFHYEDDILEPEPLDTPDKSETYKINKDFVDSDDSEDDQHEEQEHYKNLILSQTDGDVNDNLSYHFEKSDLSPQKRISKQNKSDVNKDRLLLSDSYNQFKFFQIIFSNQIVKNLTLISGN